MSEKEKSKITEFVGHMSGDLECFCLSKVSPEEWVKIETKRFKNRETVYPDPLLLYPSVFFPKECKEGKWKFTIVVKAEKLEAQK